MGGMGYGGGSSYAESMYKMTEMLQTNSMMLEQMQEHVGMTFGRFQEVAMWVWALKDCFKADVKQIQQKLRFDSKEAQDDAMQRSKRRIKLLLLFLALFLWLLFRDSRRRGHAASVEAAWLSAKGSLL